MRTPRLSTSLRLAAVMAACSLPWMACSDLKGYASGTEAASDQAASSGAGTTTGGGAAPSIEARFELPKMGAPPFLDVPFPSDLYLSDKGLIADVPGLDGYVTKNASFLVAGLAPLDGFGTSAGAIFAIDDLTGEAPLPAAVDLKTLPATEADSLSAKATAMIVDLEAMDAKDALIPARADYHDDTTNGAKAKPLLVVYPARGIVLREKRGYAVVITTGIKTKDGEAIAPSPTFAAIRDGAQRATTAEKAYGAAIDKVASLVPALKDKKTIAAVAIYHTQNTTHELIELRAAQSIMGGPKLSWDPVKIAPMGAGLFAAAPLPPGYTATLDAWLGAPAKLPDLTDDPADDSPTGRGHAAIAAIGTGVFDSPNLLIESAMGYEDPLHHTFARDPSGAPIVNAQKPTSKIWMTLALPKGPVPANGFPVVMVQHGIGGDRSLILSIADTFAKRGWATAAIESVTFGPRAVAADVTVDAKAGFAWSAGGASYDGPDGFVDLPNGNNDFFGGLKNLGSLRDQMRQSVLDIGRASDLLRTADLDLGPLLLAVPGAKIDATKVAFLGNSLGGLMGSMLAAIDPKLTTFVLNVPGGGLMTELGANSPGIASSLKLAAALNFGFAKGRFAPGHPLLQIIQHIVDPGDPLTFARHIVTDPVLVSGTKNPRKSVLQIEVLFDETVANPANEALARAMGIPLATPNVGSLAGVPFVEAPPSGGIITGVPTAEITSVLIQVGPATHSSNLFSAKGQHLTQHPYGQFDTMEPFPPLAMPFDVNQPYLALQQTVGDYLAGGFVTNGVPQVKNPPAPILDFDDDGFPDPMDADPNDPTKH